MEVRIFTYLYPHPKDIDKEKIKDLKVTDVFIPINNPDYPDYNLYLKDIIKELEDVGVSVHIWVDCFPPPQDSTNNPESSTKINNILSLITNVISGYKVKGVHLTNIGYSGVAPYIASTRTPHGKEKVSQFITQVKDTIKAIDKDVELSIQMKLNSNLATPLTGLTDIYGEDFIFLKLPCDFIIPNTDATLYNSSEIITNTMTELVDTLHMNYIQEGNIPCKIYPLIKTYNNEYYRDKYSIQDEIDRNFNIYYNMYNTPVDSPDIQNEEFDISFGWCYDHIDKLQYIPRHPEIYTQPKIVKKTQPTKKIEYDIKKYLLPKNKILIQDIGGWYRLYEIKESRIKYRGQEAYIELEAYGDEFNLIDCPPVIQNTDKEGNLIPQSPRGHLEWILINDILYQPDKCIDGAPKIVDYNGKNPYEALKILAETYDSELQFKCYIKDGKIIKTVDLIQRVGVDKKKIIELSYNLKEIEITIDNNNIKTGIIPFAGGSETEPPLTIEDIEWKKGVNTITPTGEQVPAPLTKPIGFDTLIDPEATKRFGIWDDTLEGYRPRFLKYNGNEKTSVELIWAAYNELLKYKDPVINIKTDVSTIQKITNTNESFNLGDTVNLKLPGNNLGGYTIPGRVIKIERQRHNPNTIKIEIGNFIYKASHYLNETYKTPFQDYINPTESEQVTTTDPFNMIVGYDVDAVQEEEYIKSGAVTNTLPKELKYEQYLDIKSRVDAYKSTYGKDPETVKVTPGFKPFITISEYRSIKTYVEQYMANNNGQTPSSIPIYPETNTGVPPTHTNIKVLKAPYYKQETNYTCGPASARMILGYYGVNVTEKEIAKVAKTGKRGTADAGVQEAIKHFGKKYNKTFEFKTFNSTQMSTVKSYIKKGYPVLCHVGTGGMKCAGWRKSFGHYLVWLGYNNTEDKVFIHDPGKGKQWISSKCLRSGVEHRGGNDFVVVIRK